MKRFGRCFEGRSDGELASCAAGATLAVGLGVLALRSVSTGEHVVVVSAALLVAVQALDQRRRRA